MTLLEDRMAISDLVATYSAAANRLSARDMEKCFAPDAVVSGVAELVGLPKADIVGARAIGDVFANAYKGLIFCQHIATLADVRIDGNHARATTMVLEPYQPLGQPVLLIVADYDDTFIRLPEGWRFTRRAYRVKWNGPISTTIPPS